MDTNNTNNMESKELLQSGLETLRAKQGFICDMDGVIYHGNRLLPGVKEFVDWLYRENKHFLFLTNSSERSPKELQQKLGRMGLDVDELHCYSSARATAYALLLRRGRRILGVHSVVAVMIGDRMDTDMVAGIETGLYTALVLSGVTDRADIKKFPYRPQLVLNGVGDIPDVPAK